MASFRGLLEVEGETDSSLMTDVDVSAGHIALFAHGSEIGRWDLNDVTIAEHDGAFRISTSDGVVLLHLNDPKRFAGTVGVTLSPSFDEEFEPAVPVVADKIPAVEPPLESDQPQESVVAASPPPQAPEISEPTKQNGSDATPLAKHLSWSLVGAAAILFVGGLLSWGPVRLTNSNFPLERLLVVLAAFGTVAAAYLGLALEKRRDVALVAMISGVIAVLVIVMFARRAAIGWGFIVTILGAVAVFSVSILALSSLGAPPETSNDD